MSQVGSLTLTSNELHEVTTQKAHVLGVKAQTKDGRVYRYAKNGSSALSAGATVEKSATTAATSTVDGDVPAASHRVTVDNAVTAANAPKYEDGILTVDGAKYLVQGVAGKEISLVDRNVAPIADGEATSLAANQYCGVAAGSTTVIGTAEVAVPANAYFWAFVSL